MRTIPYGRRCAKTTRGPTRSRSAAKDLPQSERRPIS